MLICAKCKQHGDAIIDASAHKCSTCAASTYAALVYCTGCALEKNLCQECGEQFDAKLNSEQIQELQLSRIVFEQKVKDIKKAYNAVVSPIKALVVTFEKESRKARADFIVQIKPFQKAFEKKRAAIETVPANKLEAARAALALALDQLQVAQTKATAAMEKKLAVAEHHLGVANLAAYQTAKREKFRAKIQADRAFDEEVRLIESIVVRSFEEVD